MTSSTNYFIRKKRLRPLSGLLLPLLLWGCAAGPPATHTPRISSTDRIAVLPVHNLTGVPAPLDEIHRQMKRRLKTAGFDLVSEKEMEAFLRRHRFRYMGGIERERAESLGSETGARAVLITSLEFYDEYPPPKMALTARLVAADSSLRLLWIDGFGLAGDDHRGLLDLGLIEEPATLLDAAMNRLASSLLRHFSDTVSPVTPPEESVLPPETVYRNPSVLAAAGPRIAVLPFLNSSLRRNAGDIMSGHFLDRLFLRPEFELLEPGAIRSAMLEARIVMAGGISMADARLLFDRLNVDLLLSGQVLQYEDYQGPNGQARVCFSATLFERGSQQAAWNVHDCRDGDHGVWFFDFGKYRTAHTLAGAMAEGAVRSIFAQ